MAIVIICYVLSCVICFGFVNAYFQGKYLHKQEDSELTRILQGIVLSCSGPVSLVICFFLSGYFEHGWFYGKESKAMKLARVENRLDFKNDLSYFGDR